MLYRSSPFLICVCIILTVFVKQLTAIRSKFPKIIQYSLQNYTYNVHTIGIDLESMKYHAHIQSADDREYVILSVVCRIVLLHKCVHLYGRNL